MHHNDVDYWRYLTSLHTGHIDLPSPRVCRLLERIFQRWKEKPLWLDENDVGHLFLDRNDLSEEERDELAKLPVSIRKSLAVKRMFEVITNPFIAEKAGSFSVDPDELVLGTMPPFSVGQGKEFVLYLTEDERLTAMLSYLSERSPMGHIVPNHERAVTVGFNAIINDCEKLAAKNPDQENFYTSVKLSLEAVIFFASQYAEEAKRVAATLPDGDARISSLIAAAQRLIKIPAQKPDTFIEAVQCIYILHCAFHWTAEIVPIGRLDQILFPFYERDVRNGILTPTAAQEILDCFWIKLGERAMLNRRHIENRCTATDGVLTGFFGSSNYDQGGLANQWMQQITIGGVLPNDEQYVTDASNAVTRMCIQSSRRLPLNSPTLDLRVHTDTPQDILELAAQTLLSGGAHPVLLNDDKIIKGLIEGGAGKISLSAARNYACDGCYETMIAGESEFSFGFVSAPELIEKALNRGAGLAAAGPIHLIGTKDSWRTEAAPDITSWDKFLKLIKEHMVLSCHRYINTLMLNYGNKVNVCPSPLLSAFIGGCIESGRDLTDGGARYHVFSPLLTGISTAADSLYAIKKLVFEEKELSLTELLTALSTNWGAGLIHSNENVLPALGIAVSPKRIDEIRTLCNDQAKFGFGNKEVDVLAWDLINTFCDCVHNTFSSSVHQQAYKALQNRYNNSVNTFDISLIPGVGTFEQYMFSGSFLGASADGRRSGDAIASDLSPAPVHRDIAAIPANGVSRHARVGTLEKSFESYVDSSMNRLGDGAPADYNLPEDYPVDQLVARLRDFANGNGGSISTYTVADPATFANAQKDPDSYNLLRVRMGGWTEFFICLFPEHQEQHRRRPLFIS
ncbi:dehydrogenase [Flavobacterium noncentrifugens]|uniref:Pyruvate-formate lyase n=1 Tax=Flavobacterium noncentrifugens TaxID=1128970 RepID=A0A1G8WHN2_9FLAO|nr:pyruvate formate lyase family protein [Flavobacterium noncentrifugens]GEP50930.1 dehydrogenase [Flavobacterium noncentrifugens]SDJ77603.1 Pyruvate-formate lyase [Flavobacterium noncentrifugens]